MQEDFDAFNLPPSNSTSNYLYRLVDDTICRKIERLTAEDAEEQCQILRITMDVRYTDLLTLLMMRAMIPSQIVGRYNDSPFYLTHPDLHNRNIIIEGKPIHESCPTLARNHSSAAACQPIPLQESQTKHTRTISFTKPNGSPPDKLKIVGIIDWDAAQPIPLQCAAIYPKFLETLPGAEFPDLPENYKPPDLDQEKEMYLEIFRKKELQQTGKTVVADLIKDSSWERDFFHVALARGDVRLEWFQSWKKEQVEQGLKHILLSDEFLQKDVNNIRAGLHGFLAHRKNIDLLDASCAWPLIWKVSIDLEQFETRAAEIAWIKLPPKKWAPVKPVRLQGCAVEANVPTRVASHIRDIEDKSLTHQGGRPDLSLPMAPAAVDNYVNFVLGDAPGRIIEARGEARRDVGL